jgi:hypothetical protein
MQLSENLSLAEMISSDSAKRKGIDNHPNPQQTENLQLLANKIFQPIRDHFKNPIHISSGFRSIALNKSIGGASSSQHCKGEAMDIDMDGTGITNAQVFFWIKDNLNFDQLIWEFGNNNNPDWVHVSYSSNGKQRKQILKATNENGKKSYINY